MSRHAPAHRAGTRPTILVRRLGAQVTTRARAIGRGLHRTTPWRARVLLGLAGAAVGLTFLGAGAAFAYWVTTDSSHPAQTVASTLSTPTAGTQNGTATPSSVPIKWTAPSGYTPTGYTVLRCTGSSCTNFTAISSGTCSGTISGTSCTDTGLSAGTTYSYEVEGRLDNWVSSPGGSFTAATSAASKLVFTVQPGSGQNIQAAGTGNFSVSVTIEDANGNPASGDNSDTVTLAIASGDNPGGGTLSCTGGVTATVSSGVATFTGCAITKAGSGYQLTASSATSPSLTAPANANSFNITAGTPSQVIATSGGNQSATTSAAFVNPLVATVEDANGNPVSGISVTFTAPSMGASATFASGCTSNPNAHSCIANTGGNGQATSSAFTANGTAGSYTISASSTGASPASFSETNTAPVSITSVVTANTTGGTAGKLDPGDTVTVTFSGQIDAHTVCSLWTNGSTGIQTAKTGSVVTVTANGNSKNKLSFTTPPSACGTFNFGTIDLGNNQYVISNGTGSSATFSDSGISYDGAAHTLVITLGALTNNGGATEGTVASSALNLSLSSSVLDTGDNSLSVYTFTTASGRQF